MAKREITLKQHAFITEYLRNGRKPAAAYKKAYERPDLSDDKAAIRALRVRKNPIIQEYLEDARLAAQAEIEDAIAAYALSKGRVALELAHMAFANIKDFWSVGEDGFPRLDFSRLTDAQWAALQEVTVDEYMEGQGEFARPVKKAKFKLHDKRQAAVDLAKLMGYMTDKAGETSPANVVNIESAPGLVINFVEPKLPSPSDSAKVIEGSSS